MDLPTTLAEVNDLSQSSALEAEALREPFVLVYFGVRNYMGVVARITSFVVRNNTQLLV